MCGIIGYIGKNNPCEVLLHGLYALEYRGYDSAGVAVSSKEDTTVIKSVGRVSKLEEEIKKKKFEGLCYGIAHTRWATNGEANLVNSHPHQVGHVTLVHNGIIENADLLKENLIQEGYQFHSDTDSEVIAGLLDFLLKDNDILMAISLMREKLVGSYALGIMIEGDSSLYALRKDSPLLIGIGDCEYFLASDITAIIQYTNRYFLLDEGDVAVLKEDSYEVFRDYKVVDKEVLVSSSNLVDRDKMGYDHYMFKEIMEETGCIHNLVQRYQDDDMRHELDLSDYEEVDIVACGSAMYAGLVGQSLFEEYASIKTNVYSASEYRYKKKIYNNKTLVILISQSGETADTIAAMREVQSLNIDTLAIVNNEDSTIAREASRKILTEAGVEIAVATTKAYISQVFVLSLMAYVTATKKEILKEEICYSDFCKLPSLIDEVIANKEHYSLLAHDLYQNETCFYIGRGIDFALCMEGSLKLKEVSYIHSEAYQAGELKHGTISLIEEGMPVIAIITNPNLKDKTVSNLKEVEARGAKAVVVTTTSLDDFSDYSKIVVPSISPFMDSILVVTALQLLSYYVALYRGCDIDKPRNLAKSVTVE